VYISLAMVIMQSKVDLYLSTHMHYVYSKIKRSLANYMFVSMSHNANCYCFSIVAS